MSGQISRQLKSGFSARLLVLCLCGCGLLSGVPAVRAATSQAGNLPLIRVEAKGVITSDKKVPCTLTVSSEGADEKARPGVIRLHGASSLSYPKKSLGITFEAPAPLLAMRNSAHWVLNAAFIDRSLMRHKLSYDLFRSLSATNAPRFAAASRFVEVNLNGSYQGVFLLMERVDRTMLRLQRFDTNAPQHACIYKAIDHAATFAWEGHGGFEQREPDPLAGPYWAPLDELNRFVSRSSDAEFFDPRHGIATRLDLDNTIDFHLLILLTSNMDGFDKNIIIARDAPAKETPAPRFFFVPWDYDATFGRNWEGSRVGTSHWLSNHLFDRLLSNAEYRRKFTNRWKELRQRQFSGAAIHKMIDDNTQQLGAAVNRNASRWKEAEGYYPDPLTFAQDIAEMKQWVTQRSEWLDHQIDHLTGH